MEGHEHCNHHEHNHEGIEIKTHDESLVITLSREVPKDLADVKTTCENCISDFSGWIQESGGIVGHIKGSIHPFDKGYTFSCTDDLVYFKESEISNVLVKLVAIIYGVNELGLSCKVAEIFETL